MPRLFHLSGATWLEFIKSKANLLFTFFKMTLFLRNNGLFLFAASCMAFLGAQARAEEPVVAQSKGVTVQTVDLKAESLRIPEAARKTHLSKPENVQQLANTILTRKLLAAEAEQAGLHTDPVIAAQIKIARDRVLAESLVAKLEANSTPSAAALEKYARDLYKADVKRFERPERWRARHILVRSGVKEEAKAKAEKLLSELRTGAAFDDLARKHSEDPGSAAKGGDLGFFQAGRMVQPFEEAVRKLKPGEYSEVVETQFGFHIVRLEEARSKGVAPFDEVRDELMREAMNKTIADARSAKLATLTQDAQFNKTVIESFAESQK